MNYNDDFLSTTGDALSDMRVLIEGAIIIFENDSLPINRLCTQHQEYEARTAFNDIGGALYNLRGHIRHLQDALRKALDQTEKENTND
ncbi:MAG: hypothetical protein IJD99_08045 [Clostridia bacterium]|nr:hypothetical protein [Clostridia bacterium]